MAVAKYKAHVYLKKPLFVANTGMIACLDTAISSDKESVLAFVKALYDQEFIQSYRMVYSPMGDDYWYNDKEVVYLGEHQRRVITNFAKNKWVKERSSGNDGYRNELTGEWIYESEYESRFNPIVDANGNKRWYINGQCHREDGPAIEYTNGDKEWFLNGKLHREDGPACEYADGSKFWYKDGKCHREDGPACEYSNGDKSWFLNGKLHREDGPACERANGVKDWYLNGLLHRIDGPAVESSSGYKAWYLNGKLHRENGPAKEYPNGSKAWYKNGEKHREDGPAVELTNGKKFWFINGFQISHSKYKSDSKLVFTNRE